MGEVDAAEGAATEQAVAPALGAPDAVLMEHQLIERQHGSPGLCRRRSLAGGSAGAAATARIDSASPTPRRPPPCAPRRCPSDPTAARGAGRAERPITPANVAGRLRHCSVYARLSRRRLTACTAFR